MPGKLACKWVSPRSAWRMVRAGRGSRARWLMAYSVARFAKPEAFVEADVLGIYQRMCARERMNHRDTEKVEDSGMNYEYTVRKDGDVIGVFGQIPARDLGALMRAWDQEGFTYMLSGEHPRFPEGATVAVWRPNQDDD